MSLRRAGSSSNVAAGGGSSVSQEQAHWMGFIDELRVLPPADFSQLGKLNEAYSPRMAPNPGHVQPAANLQITLERAKNRGKYASTQEMVEAFQQEYERSRMQAEVLGRAQKHLDELIVLKRANPDADSGRRQKRRLSPTPSASSRHASPLPAISGSSAMAGAAAASVRSASPLHPLPSAKRRIEALQNQLPLRPGRQVVCKEPKSASGGDAEPGWILAKVVKMIGADKMRYEVEDADDEGERKRYNITLKTIIPLADKTALPSSPSHPSAYRDIPAGTSVFALYPETTTFYRGRVIQAPIPGTGMGKPAPPAATGPDPVHGRYLIAFEEDTQPYQMVASDMVVESIGA